MTKRVKRRGRERVNKEKRRNGGGEAESIVDFENGGGA